MRSFDCERHAAKLHSAIARWKEADVASRGTVLSAFQDVEDILKRDCTIVNRRRNTLIKATGRSF